jgi:hypothetical protein
MCRLRQGRVNIGPTSVLASLALKSETNTETRLLSLDASDKKDDSQHNETSAHVTDGTSEIADNKPPPIVANGNVDNGQSTIANNKENFPLKIASIKAKSS